MVGATVIACAETAMDTAKPAIAINRIIVTSLKGAQLPARCGQSMDWATG